MKIRFAEASDYETIERLLVTNGLPVHGVREALGSFLVAEDGDDIVGVAGIDRHGAYALLRSVAVDEKWRSHGVARRLVERLVEAERARETAAVYLLTTTAERYFPTFGFQTTTRDLVPDPIRATGEFQYACPASATVMTLALR
ncbi:MAG: arsenic resistance N-acetyltransferase ArsN2 [Gemmatimonadota bacterium]